MASYSPRLMYPVKASLGKAIAENFFQTHTATLSKEVDQFQNRLEQQAQFVLGSFPSIYGGTMEGTSGTLGEYAMSRNQALQRLQLIWKILVNFWPKVIEKAVRSYAKNLKEDESFAKKQGESFINVWIRQSEVTGNVGLVEAEASESFPISWAQKRDILIQMIQYKDPNIAAALFHPENASMIARIIGFPELYIPGDEDRTKQLAEIAKLILAAPIPAMMPMTPMEQMAPTPDMGQEQPFSQPAMDQPTVMPEPELDNHAIHIEVIRAWANGSVGQSVRENNPQGYANVIAHLKMHMTMLPPPMPVEGEGEGENQPPSSEGEE